MPRCTSPTSAERNNRGDDDNCYDNSNCPNRMECKINIVDADDPLVCMSSIRTAPTLGYQLLDKQ